jgi:hypothetical protein
MEKYLVKQGEKKGGDKMAWFRDLNHAEKIL